MTVSKPKIFTDLTLKVTPYSSIVGQSLTIHHPKHGVVAQLSIRVPQTGMDYRTVAQAVASALMDGHVSKNGVTLVLPDDFAGDAA